LLVREWVNKPGSMLARTCIDPVEAVSWLRDEVRQHALLIRPSDPHRLRRLLGYLDHRHDPQPESQRRCRFGICDVLCCVARHDRVVHWQYRLVNGHGLAWAIVPNRAEDLRGAGRLRGEPFGSP
jgi:hypothetical protein